MTNLQKANVWLAAMRAIPSGSRFGEKLLLSSDVAHALGLIAQFDESTFILHAKKKYSAYPAGKILAKFVA
jgi:hypothetical protein